MIGEKVVAGSTLYFDGERWWVRAERLAAVLAQSSPNTTAEILNIVERGWKNYEPDETSA